MTGIRKLASGALLACLLISLTSCASKPPIVRTETVEVPVPVVVDVPAELTQQEPEPQLKQDPVNADLADWIDALKAWGRGAYCKLEKIANLGPGPDSGDACAKVPTEGTRP